MQTPMSSADHAAIAAIVATLERAWNAGDGIAFSEPFAEDADFVDIRADRHRGRDAIAAGHAAILQTIYAGSTNQYTLEGVRAIGADVALAHVRAVLEAPTGPLAGRNVALFSMVLVREADGWCITSFHNTLAPPVGPRR